MEILIFAAIQILIVGILWYRWKYPVILTDKRLKECIQKEEDTGDMLKSLDGNMILLPEICELMQKYAKEKNRESSERILDKEAKLTALQSQINPHFLYNTLESIRGQALVEGNDEIAKMMQALASFFRYSISRKGSLVTLRDELANIQNYMLIQRYRFNNRFSLQIFIDEDDQEAYEYLVPRLIIQPVVENAVYHGLEECLEGGKVEIEVIITEKNLILTVSDNGKGMDEGTLQKVNQRLTEYGKLNKEKDSNDRLHTGIALPNIHWRIQLLFGEEYGLQIYSTLNQGTDVEITIPANYERRME